MYRRRAFLISEIKDGIVDLASGLEQRGVPIYAFDDTRDAIEKADIEVTDAADLIYRPEENKRFDMASNAERRVLIANYVGPLLRAPRSELINQSQHPMDIAIVNLHAPRYVPETGGVDQDDTGKLFMDAAIGGGRLVLSHPNQAEVLFAALDGSEGDLEQARQQLMVEALAHQRDHIAQAERLLQDMLQT